MAGYSVQQRVSAPPERVFAFVTDQAQLPRWSRQVVESEVVGGGPVGAGSRLRQVRKAGGREMVSELEVVEHSEPEAHAVRTSFMGMNAVFRFTFAAEGDGTIVTMASTLEPRHLLGRVSIRLLRGTMERADGEALSNLARVFEEDTA